MKTIASLVLAAIAATTAAPALAQPQFAQPADAIKYRQDTFKELRDNFGRVGNIASGKAPFDARIAADSAAAAAEIIRKLWAGFGPGTEGGKARPAIWKEQDRFKELAVKAEGELDKLAAAAKTGSLDAIKAAIGPAAASCKACHDAYRN
ncbi:c-type cytochrome [Xylophilus sp.]|uniref:c-type cytochrome n=1 Tax=Xylophilus sp. TaxID=2653893 RepID=UPI0013BD971D|nr:cytochrome c [Xylophilus sp.]KAF1044851.1 MAG: Cytochrome c' [Xylophilus sp.]